MLLCDLRGENYIGHIKQEFPNLADFPKFEFGYLPTDPGLEICKIARQTRADLILVGCHDDPDKQNITRLDYVGMTILEKAPCPIMLVPP